MTRRPFFNNALPLLNEGASYEHMTAASRFRRVLVQGQRAVIAQLNDRRARQVYLLSDGQRSIGEIAWLLRLSPVEVARLMRRLLDLGYVEYASAEE